MIERGDTLVPVEIKSGDRLRPDDARHIRAFMEEYGDAVPHGVILYPGTRAEPIADRIWAVPLSAALGLSRVTA